jgi:hypothetical protein
VLPNLASFSPVSLYIVHARVGSEDCQARKIVLVFGQGLPSTSVSGLANEPTTICSDSVLEIPRVNFPSGPRKCDQVLARFSAFEGGGNLPAFEH